MPGCRRRRACSVARNERMEIPRNNPAEGATQGESRFAAVINWLALLMLLAGSVVWPR